MITVSNNTETIHRWFTIVDTLVSTKEGYHKNSECQGQFTTESP